MSRPVPAGTRSGICGERDPGLVEVPDGERGQVGAFVARDIEAAMRSIAHRRGADGAYDIDAKMCPDCYMVVLFNAAMKLAKLNGQPPKELCMSLGNLFLAAVQQDNYEPIESNGEKKHGDRAR